MTNESTRRSETNVSLTEAQENFGEIFARVSHGGRVFITRDDKPEAVVLSVRDYEALTGPEQVDLAALERDFDEMFEQMQGPRQRSAVDALMRMGSEEVADAFAEEARRKSQSER